MLSILRTIAIIDIATNAVLAAVAWLFGMTWTQTVGAGLVALIVLVVAQGWATADPSYRLIVTPEEIGRELEKAR